MLSKNTETYLDNDLDDELKSILDSIHYLELETSKLGYFKTANLLKKARTQSDNSDIINKSYFESQIHSIDYLSYLQSLKTMQQNLEDAGLSEESEIIKLAIMSLFCKYDQRNTILKQLN